MPASEITTRLSRAATSVMAGLFACLAALPARAILINGEGPANVTGIYDRFIVGTYPGTPVANPSFIGSAFDLSGVGWLSSDPTHCFTLVSSRYFVGATHHMPNGGSTLLFAGTDHLLYSATVDAVHALTYTGTDGAQVSDVSVGRLTLALPTAVTPMPIFYAGNTSISSGASFDAYAGASLFNYGHTARMGTNAIDGFAQFSFAAGPQTNIGLVYSLGTGAGETLLEGGDSGSPTIASQNGVYGLIGTHSGVSGSFSLDGFVSYTEFVNQMNVILGTDGQSLTFATVPEPGAMLFGVLLLGFCGTQRMRRGRDAGR
ncbi:MAG: hypothetical protein WCK55_13240 [Verrucomicrobiota bacterium]